MQVCALATRGLYSTMVIALLSDSSAVDCLCLRPPPLCAFGPQSTHTLSPNTKLPRTAQPTAQGTVCAGCDGMGWGSPNRGVRKELDFCQEPPLGTAPRDHQPPITNHHQPLTANRRQPPAATNRQPPTTANRHQPPIPNHQPPPTTTNLHQPPHTASRQPPTTNRPPPTHGFFGKTVSWNLFFFPVNDRPGHEPPGPWPSDMAVGARVYVAVTQVRATTP